MFLPNSAVLYPTLYLFSIIIQLICTNRAFWSNPVLITSSGIGFPHSVARIIVALASPTLAAGLAHALANQNIIAGMEERLNVLQTSLRIFDNPPNNS